MSPQTTSNREIPTNLSAKITKLTDGVQYKKMKKNEKKDFHPYKHWNICPKKKTLRIDESNYLEHQDSKISQNNQFNTFRFLLLSIHQSSNSNETIILDEGLPFKNREHEHGFVSEATVSLPNESALNNCASSNIKRSHDPTCPQHQKFPVCHYTGGTNRTSQIFGHNWPAQFLWTKTLFQLVPNSKDIVQ